MEPTSAAPGLASSRTLYARRKPCRVLIVDDHPLVRRGLRGLLSHEAEFEVCGETGETEEALRLMQELTPDVTVIDLSLKTGSGLDLVKAAATQFPSMQLLVCSMHDESLFAERCLRAGARGYLNKEASGEQVIGALRTIRDGKTFLSPHMSERLLRRIVSGASMQQSPMESLTNRELEVFGHIGNGLTTRQIAERLQLSYKTIESYRENIKAKLSLKNAAELSRHAVKWNLENG